ncbi:hypothetical protein [Kosakonia oryziphila]|uniref:Uncharacterized protein n=1 Tax=Kosakonia oryziphila TaxID=1005667 RepID=A0A1C4G333_9ENTR|nr:hypothetical protein [Kosakonia oryziphila]SCC62171.1 hypothetical protein GA0061070_104920 [Kosakonia oryziphila]
MAELRRQDIQQVNITAEQLAGLAQTLFEYHEKLDHFQLRTLCSLVYDMSSRIHDWTEREEEIVLKLEDKNRNG